MLQRTHNLIKQRSYKLVKFVVLKLLPLLSSPSAFPSIIIKLLQQGHVLGPGGTALRQKSSPPPEFTDNKQ